MMLVAFRVGAYGTEGNILRRTTKWKEFNVAPTTFLTNDPQRSTCLCRVVIGGCPRCKVRLRDPLPTLCQNPEIYDRSKVSADCFDALHCLRMLRKVDRLREAAEQGLFPEGAQLIQVCAGGLLSHGDLQLGT